MFGESYDKNWVAYVGKDRIDDRYHFEVNGYANAWYLEKAGSYTVTVDYSPQNLFYIGAVVTVSTLMVSTAYLIFISNPQKPRRADCSRRASWNYRRMKLVRSFTAK